MLRPLSRRLSYRVETHTWIYIVSRAADGLKMRINVQYYVLRATVYVVGGRTDRKLVEGRSTH